jgi:hypothetical protein
MPSNHDPKIISDPTQLPGNWHLPMTDIVGEMA